MWIPVAIVLAWIFYRRREGLSVVPDFFGHPFVNGGILVNTEKGVVVVPADTPVMHPIDAIDQQVITPHEVVSTATAIVSQTALAPPMNLVSQVSAPYAPAPGGGGLISATTGNY